MFDQDFDQAVRPLFVPGMGTEHVAPWLYSLVRLTRPRRVLEVGLGYTTPLLARALADTMARFHARTLREQSVPDLSRLFRDGLGPFLTNFPDLAICVANATMADRGKSSNYS